MEKYRPSSAEHSVSAKNDSVDAERIEFKRRYDPITREEVVVVEDKESRERLDELREMSNVLNKKLQNKIDQAGLLPYYSWNKSSGGKQKSGVVYPKIMRLAILLRPEHFKSTEEKNEATRYSAGDQVSVFLHLTPENAVQMIRYHSGFSQSANMNYFVDDFFPEHNDPERTASRKHLDLLAKNKDLEGLADFMIEQLVSPETQSAIDNKTFIQHTTEVFQKAYTINSIGEARAYFSFDRDWMYQAREIVRNTAKVVVTSILESEIQRLLLRASSKRDEIFLSLNTLAEKVGDVEVARYRESNNGKSTSKLREVISDYPAFITQTIKEIIRVYKPQIMGWGEKKK